MSLPPTSAQPPTGLSARGASEPPVRRRLVVLAGPSAVGKGTVAKRLRELHPDIWFSVSATTRLPRPGEQHGVHYWFVDDREFDALIAERALLEWAWVHGQARYGTPRQPVLDALAAGRRAFLEIDLAGAAQVREAMPEALQVFLAPPSWAELERRLIGRGTETAEERAARLASAEREMAAADRFDEVIVNESVDQAVADLVSLIDNARPEHV